MKPFMNKDFILESETAIQLYENYAKTVPIIDFHNHLNTQEIWEDKKYNNMADMWLGVDHYKWRAMRAHGVSERLITGAGDPFEKFLAWADTVQAAIGNPLYSWAHLELQRYFGIKKTLNKETAEEIWTICNEKLQTAQYSVRNLLRMQNVEILCTTDDPIDELNYHKKLRESDFEIRVLPTFRPEKAVGIEKAGFKAYIKALESQCGRELKTVSALLDALRERLAFFVEMGCVVTDHSLEGRFFVPAALDEVETIYHKGLLEERISGEECAKYRGFLLGELGREYARKGLVMQLHIGAMRNNSHRIYEKLGTDVGLDSMNDFSYAAELSGLLSYMDYKDELPKTVLYYLNPKDLDMLSSLAGDFQTNESGIKGKVQLGTAWWFCDNKAGMERQMEALANNGLLSAFIGMLTDSRSFLSFPRHEYFRRILCNLVGKWVENGEYPADLEYLGKMINNICGDNARAFFSL